MFVFVFSFLAKADNSSPTIEWMSFNYPPVFISQGKLSNKGFGNVHESSLISCLKNYKHITSKNLSITRIFKDLSIPSERVKCISAIGSFPGEIANSSYSNISFSIPNTVLIYRKEDANKFKATNDEVSLETTLNNRLLSGAIVKNGTYGKSLTPVLEKKRKKMISRTPTDSEGLYRMLLHKRFDYSLDYPNGYHFVLNKEFKDRKDELSFFFIKENKSERYNTAYVVCQNSPISKKVINDINKCLNNDKHKTKVADSVKFHLPEMLKEPFYKINLDSIGKEKIINK